MDVNNIIQAAIHAKDANSAQSEIVFAFFADK